LHEATNPPCEPAEFLDKAAEELFSLVEAVFAETVFTESMLGRFELAEAMFMAGLAKAMFMRFELAETIFAKAMFVRFKFTEAMFTKSMLVTGLAEAVLGRLIFVFELIFKRPLAFEFPFQLGILLRPHRCVSFRKVGRDIMLRTGRRSSPRLAALAAADGEAGHAVGLGPGRERGEPVCSIGLAIGVPE
jgi:hypothetical protein